MNGSVMSLLIWLANGLIALLAVVIGFTVQQHVNSDKEHRNRMDMEINTLRQKVHDLSNKFAGIQLKKLK